VTTKHALSTKENLIMSSRNETIVRNAFEMTFNQGALEELSRYFSADVRRHNQASPYADRDLPALWEHIQTVRHACPDGRLKLNDALVAEDLVAFWWTFRGAQDAGSLGFLPVALAVDLSGSTVVHLADGKIDEIWELGDNLASLAATAAVAAPALVMTPAMV
jgi:predicted ester cyclase